jgi:ribokinase
MVKKIKIVVLGSLLYDCVVWADRLPRKGETVIGERSGFFIGGKGANQAVQAAKLGAHVYMIGCVGNDEIGDRVLDSIQSSGVDITFVRRDSDIPTGTCCIHVNKEGDNGIIIAPHANLANRIEDIDKAQDVIRDADIFLTQLEINSDVVGYGLKLARDYHIPTVLNPAPACHVDDWFFEFADYVTPNETETEFYTHINMDIFSQSACADAAHRLQARGASNVVLTLGKNGCYFSGQGRSIWQPAFSVEAVDATAAGDAFNAALAYCIASKKPISAALNYANAAGALAASKQGAQSSLATLEEIRCFLSK